MKRDTLPREIIQMPHPGHFIGAQFCRFHRNTYVNGYIVSTVGEYHGPFTLPGTYSQLLTADPKSFYETMTFRAVRGINKCCPYAIASGRNIEAAHYETADEATKGHEKFVRRYARKKK